MSRCGHYLYNCGPRRDKNYLGEKTAEAVFRRIIRLGCHSVHIGGGEPLLDPEKLVIVLRAAHRDGMGIDYVETNSAWFVDMQPATEVLESLFTSSPRPIFTMIHNQPNGVLPRP